jgi:copper oxidase (laccase) domain-containing protein
MMTTTTSTSRRSSSDADRAPLLTPTRSLVVPRPDGPSVRVCWTVRADGDFHRTEVALDELEPRRRALVDLPWTMLDEQHGTVAVRVEAPGAHDGAVGDIAITDVPGAVLGCWVGDCAPVVLIGERREIAVVHAGWRGLAAGVIETALDAFREPVVAAVLGPCIWACCYEFGPDVLRSVAAGVRADVASITSTTSQGRVALDVPAAVATALSHRAIPLQVVGGCTGCTYDGFSHRVRDERERHVVAAWIAPGSVGGGGR